MQRAREKNFQVQWESYLLFCTYFQFVSLPSSTETLQLFAQILRRTFKSTDPIRNYINRVRSMHLLLGYSVDHINKFILNLSIKGIAGHTAASEEVSSPTHKNGTQN